MRFPWPWSSVCSARLGLCSEFWEEDVQGEKTFSSTPALNFLHRVPFRFYVQSLQTSKDEPRGGNV